MPPATPSGTRRRPSPRVTPKGLWGPWLVDQRLARKRKDGSPWTQQDAFEYLRERMGWGPTSRASYLNLEHGKSEPDAAQQRALVELYKAEPPTAESTETPGVVTEPGVSDYLERIDQLVAQLAVQSAAITDLAAQVKALTERPSGDAELVNAMAATVALAVRTTLQAEGFSGGPRQP